MYLVCGEALFDFFSEEDASGQAAKLNYKAIAGGSPFNVAVGLRRLGIESGSSPACPPITLDGACSRS